MYTRREVHGLQSISFKSWWWDYHTVCHRRKFFARLDDPFSKIDTLHFEHATGLSLESKIGQTRWLLPGSEVNQNNHLWVSLSVIYIVQQILHTFGSFLSWDVLIFILNHWNVTQDHNSTSINWLNYYTIMCLVLQLFFHLNLISIEIGANLITLSENPTDSVDFRNPLSKHRPIDGRIIIIWIINPGSENPSDSVPRLRNSVNQTSAMHNLCVNP